MEHENSHPSAGDVDGDVVISVNGDEPFHGGLLLSDFRVAHLLFGELRYRAMARLFGVSREQAPLVAMIGAGLLLKGAHAKMVQAWTVPGAPTTGDAVFGASALNVLLHRIGGPASQNISAFGTLVMLAVLGHGAKPAVRASVHRAQTTSHHLHMMFDHRYGHLIRTFRRTPTG